MPFGVSTELTVFISSFVARFGFINVLTIVSATLERGFVLLLLAKVLENNLSTAKLNLEGAIIESRILYCSRRLLVYFENLLYF